MRALILGDVHLRATAPESRVDDFMETQYAKVEEALRIARENTCQLVLQPGDLCDHPYLPRYLTSRYIRLLRKSSPLWLTVLGQHDIPMRNEESLFKTTDYLFESAGVIQILGEGCQYTDAARTNRVCIQGCPYEGKEPEPNPDYDVNILLIHASIGDRPLYPDQELTNPRAFLKQHKFDLIVAGDYHYTFTDVLGDRTIVNAGCIVRKTANVWDKAHEPCVYVWDSDTRELEQHKLRIQPAEAVYITASSKADTGANAYLSRLLEALKSERRLTSDFFDNLEEFVAINKPSAAVQAVLQEAVAEVKQAAEGS